MIKILDERETQKTIKKQTKTEKSEGEQKL